jgi:hypothetical protein
MTGSLPVAGMSGDKATEEVRASIFARVIQWAADQCPNSVSRYQDFD